MLACDCELGVAQAEAGGEDFGVLCVSKLWMEFTQQLGGGESAGGVRFEQVFGLIFEVIEIWICWELSYRHGELPFVCPGPQV